MLDKAIKFFITLTCAIAGGAALRQATPFLISYINLEFFQIETGIFELTLASLVCILAGAFVGGLIGFFVSPYLISHFLTSCKSCHTLESSIWYWSSSR